MFGEGMGSEDNSSASGTKGAERGARVVLITGAAGGLGQALALAFAAQGWQVAAGVHQTPMPSGWTGVHPLPLNVNSRREVETAVENILSRWGRLDALINNGGLAADHALWQTPESDWDRVLEVNLRGAFLCAQAALRPMCEQRDGHIINISSYSGRVGARGQTSYAAAKAGLLGLTQSLAREAGLHNVRVNAVLPGMLATPMTAGLKPAVLESARAANVLGRFSNVSEVARFIVFLASLENVSGQVFQLDSRLVPWP